ncbi:hypothetical protein K503DRAFT_764872 [Rhizopogon vinicolor AM-OR11-026]|uniref:DUF4211 domain-containing protein n=1 Tax=Rhizopogon vinicolor AM-OR11-026 TaxID=1314800 RepID=A0A1B7NIS2_9AGAM|nr:hypothetical protein K503DRAFT_764872 [Rhizopogon vinicolor AM-OR11-026]
MPQKASKSLSPKKMKQKTLTGFLVLSSPPPSSPPAPVKRQARRKPKVATFDSDESESVEQDSDVDAIKFEPEVIDVSEEDDSPRRPTRSTKMRKRFYAETDDLPDAAESDGSPEDGIGIPMRWKGNQKGKRRAIEDSDDESQTRRRKFVKGARPPSPEESVMDEIDENHIIESRFRARNKKTAFQKNLEKLKNSKGNKRSKINLESSDSDTEQSGSSVVRPFKGARPDRGDGSESPSVEDDGDDNFIVEDDEQGGSTTRLPVAFSMNTHQDLAHQFKIVFQLFVHMAVRPTAERHQFMEKMLEAEEYFSVPLQVMRRKLSGMKDSLVTSSVWKPEFKKPLERHPEFQLVRMEFSVPQCDACHLGGRVSTLLGRVSGKPYNKYDFESESEDESSRSSGTDDDADDEESSVKEFHLGRFCAARTQVFHEFSHWEHRLYKSLLREIDDVLDDNRGFVRIAFAGGAKPPKDMRDADKVMDWLDQRGLVDLGWQKIRQMMDSARNLEIRAKRGDLDELDI